MKIPKNCKIEKCVSADQSRFVLHNVYIHPVAGEPGQGRAVAADGRRLVTIPVQFEPDDAEGFISPATLQMARRLTKGQDISLSANGTIRLANGMTLPRPEVCGPFPNYQQVIPKDEPKFTVGVNAFYLKDIAEAIGAEDGHVRLEFTDNLSAIRVHASKGPAGALGVLMPVRLS